MNNKTLGNKFESELCEILAEYGFWAHQLTQNAAGQPADVIAVKDTEAYLIDCKVCSQGKFPFSRIEDNQETAMELWKDCGNGNGWFALKFDDDIYMVDMGSMRNARNNRSVLTQRDAAEMYGFTLEEWLWSRS